MLFHIHWIVSSVCIRIKKYIDRGEGRKEIEWNKKVLHTYCIPCAFALMLTFNVRLD